MTAHRPGSEDAQDATPATHKPYEPPRLVEYGSIAKLTQGSNTLLSEAGGMLVMLPCL
jgi:hypothetical protein